MTACNSVVMESHTEAPSLYAVGSYEQSPRLPADSAKDSSVKCALVTVHAGREFRRVPTPSCLTPRSLGRAFRLSQIQLKQQRSREVEEDELRWRRLVNSKHEADPDRRARALDEGLRSSILYCAAAARHRSAEVEVASSSVSIPWSASSKALRKRKSKTDVETTPCYDPSVFVPALEKERSEKPFAVSHAKRDLLSIGVIESQVASMFQGHVAPQHVLDICVKAAAQHQLEDDPVLVHFSQSFTGPLDNGPPHRQSPPHGTTSEPAAAPALHEISATSTMKNFVPLGKEILRVTSAMKEASSVQSAASFERLQQAKAGVRERLTAIIDQHRSDLLATVNKIVASAAVTTSGV